MSINGYFFTGENSDISQNLTLLRTARKRRDILQSRKAIMKIMRQDKNVEKAARSRQCKLQVNFTCHVETRVLLLFIYLFVQENIYKLNGFKNEITYHMVLQTLLY